MKLMCSFIHSILIPRCSSFSLFLQSTRFHCKYMELTTKKSFLAPSNGFHLSNAPFFPISFSKQIGGLHPLQSTSFVSSNNHIFHLGFTSSRQKINLRLLMPAFQKVPKISWNARTTSMTNGISFGLWLLLLSSSGAVNAQASIGNNEGSGHKKSSVSPYHGKEVHTDYSITGIPGDGRCLFRSVVHGACIRAGKTVPNETLQRELADELRSLVADEFIKRRKETEWFIEGNFDAYVSHIRRPHVWGGEPELHMASHVLRMPITVYIYDDEAGGLIAIAEYGQEYGKEDPIRVLYDGFAHYDALQIRAQN